MLRDSQDAANRTARAQLGNVPLRSTIDVINWKNVSNFAAKQLQPWAYFDELARKFAWRRVLLKSLHLRHPKSMPQVQLNDCSCQ